LADIYFCQDEAAIRNLSRYKGEKINTNGNTLYDAVHDSRLVNKKLSCLESKKYCVFSTHRFENWANYKCAEKILNILNMVSSEIYTVFVGHPFTLKKLREYSLESVIKNNRNVVVVPRLVFSEFIGLLKGADFLVTDGGSNQEESSYLGIPCLLLRKATERNEGLDRNVVLSNLDEDVIKRFLDRYSHKASCSLSEPDKLGNSPSEVVVRFLSRYLAGF
jgi:UDP-N-acetylglucosamine 2-epimerase (non-hydrolysing)